jgi:hypothetical protein
VYSGGQQPQPTVVVVQSAPAPQSFVCHYVLSCFVFWCCGWVFGLVAFILAVIAQGKATQDAHSANQLGKASIAVSIIGIVVFVIIMIIVIVKFLVLTKTVADVVDTIATCPFSVDFVCYKTREMALYGNECPRSGHYYEKFCYYQ